MSFICDADPRLNRWAEVIVDFCTEVKAGDRVEITGEIPGKPLMLALYRRCLKAGAYPVLRPTFPETIEIFYGTASDDQLQNVHPIDLFQAKNTQVSLHVMAESNTQALAGTDHDKIAKVRIAKKELGKIRKERIRWNVTSFPTNAYAQDAGMSLAEFAEFIFDAGFLNSENPLDEWRKLRARQRTITKLLEGVSAFHIENSHADLTLGVEGRIICESSGAVNMPDGEIYTGPVENAVNGHIKFSFPGYYMGQVVDGIELEFKNGEVVRASAEANEKFLLKMLETDPGAKRVGELGIGTNWGVQQFTKNLLFDEKMGGTIHLALGDSYRETLGENRSAIHWDIIHDMRRDSRIYADKELLQENGKFVGRFAAAWDASF